MGKRKFKKPDDSESDYEWEEAKPKKQIVSTANNSRSNELEGFLNKYTTKSLSEIRSDKSQLEKDQQDKLFEERTYKPSTKNTNKSYDTQWLRKSYFRCKEQAENEGTDLMPLLRDRYDEDTIDFMIKTFGRITNHINYPRKDTRRETKTEHRSESESHQIVEERYVTETDINEACASLLRAEMSDNVSKIEKLKKKVSTLREAQKRNLRIRLTQLKKTEPSQTIMIEKAMKSGKMIPYVEAGSKFVSQSQSRPYDTREGCSVLDLLRQERTIDGDENDMAFARLSGRARAGAKTADDQADCEYNDVFVKKANKKSTGGFDTDTSNSAEKRRLIASQKQRVASVANCKRCYETLPKHLVLSKGSHFAVIVPPDCGITRFHLQLVPLDHVAACTNITDDDAWAELALLRRTIARFYRDELHGAEAVFLETVTELRRSPHTAVDCVPLPRDDRDNCDIAPTVFFRKAIVEAQSDWAQNRALLEIAPDGGIRRTVPRGFPYFCVQFGGDGNDGYAFVIEDEARFSRSFGMEIIGSMLGKDLIEINSRSKSKSFNEQADVVLSYERQWKRYDLWPVDGSDSD